MHTDDFDGFVVTINGTTHYVDGAVPDKILNTVSDYNDLLKDIINCKPVKEYYYSTLSPDQWVQLCAAMDVVRDSQRAINKYREIDQINYIHGDALYIYGLLNAFYLQQEAVKTIYEFIFEKELKFYSLYPNIDEIKKYRNDVCHATNRKQGKEQIIMSPRTVTKHGFDYLKYTTSDGKRKLHVNIDDCLAKQAHEIKAILCTICKKILSSISPDVQKEYLESWSQAMKAL
jgi:hypothetical protein